MRRFFVVALVLFSLSARSDNREPLEWLGKLSEQGIDVSAEDWLILTQNPTKEQLNQILSRYARYVDTGRLDRGLFQPGWIITEQPQIQQNKPWAVAELKALEPDIPQYKPLKQALEVLKGWQARAVELFPDDLILFKGDQHQAVGHLNQWLEDLDLASDLPEDAYSQLHKDILTQVQIKFDLVLDGRLGAMTRQALLAITNERIRTLKANLERIRWLPKTLPYPHVKVDIAGFNVAYVVNSKETHIHKAIVGTKEKTDTCFSG